MSRPPNPSRSKLLGDLCGPINIAEMKINNITCKALVDTGSSVSTISESLYTSLDVPLHPLNNILKVEAATGHILPYKGYVECNLSVNELGISDRTGLFLVVPETNFGKGVPIIMGTNLLKSMNSGTNLPNNSPWKMAFQCLALQDKQISRNEGRLALVKSNQRAKILLRSNRTMTIQCIVDKKVYMSNCLAILQPSKDSMLPNGVEITPSVSDYGSTDTIDVVITNHTFNPVVIPSLSIICELQWCTLDAGLGTESPQYVSNVCASSQLQSSNILTAFDLGNSNISPTQLSQIQSLLNDNSDIFSLNDNDLGYTNLVKHRIELNDEVPFKQRHRRIPPSMYQELRAHLQGLLDQSVIRKSHSPWCSNVVLVRKKDNSIRLCIDYRSI